MTQAPTPSRQKTRPAPRKPKDRVPENAHTLRVTLTVLGALLIAASLIWTAYCLGTSRGLASGGIMFVTGLVFTIAAQTPAFYRWAGADAKARREAKRGAKNQQQMQDPAEGLVPAQRTGEEPEVVVPHAVPAAELGPGFAYIVKVVRYVVKTRREARLAAINKWYRSVDWECDDEDASAYRQAVTHVRNLATEYPKFNPRVRFNAFLAGKFDTANPGPFLAEMDMYESEGLNATAAGAVAALMLVLNDETLAAEVTPEDRELIMEPWIGHGLPYRMGDTEYAYRNGAWVSRPAPGTEKTAAARVEEAGLVPPPEDMNLRAARNPRPAPAATPAPSPDPAPAAAAPAAGVALPADWVDLVVQAVEQIGTCQFGSTAMLQRKLRIGFALASRIMETLQEYELVGPANGDNARDVLFTREQVPGAQTYIRSELT